MYVFILLNLALSYFASAEARLPVPLTSEWLIYVGVFGMISAAILGWSTKISCVWYDLYASASLLVWLPYWYPDFRNGSPVFFYIPLYFALISAFFVLVFTRKREQIDEETAAFLQWLSDSGRFNPVVIAILVGIGLLLKQHFLIYPVAITLFVLRYVLASSLRE